MQLCFIQTAVYLTKPQKEFCEKNFVNLSRLCRYAVDDLMKKSIGSSVEPSPIENQPSSQPGGSNGR